jgi:hypothetical protein
VAGAVLLAWGTVVVAHPAWLPTVLAGSL